VRKVAIFVGTFFVLLHWHESICLAQERVRIGWAAMTASHTLLWVAQEKGLFTKHGLIPESIFFGAGPPAMQALVAGDLDAADPRSFVDGSFVQEMESSGFIKQLKR